MAIFGWKKTGGGSEQGGDGGSAPNGSGAGAVPREPEKAAKFFTHARTSHESTNYEYAMQLWLSGLRFDPASMDATEAFLKSAREFLGESGGKRPGKEVAGALASRSDVDKYLGALLDWAVRPTDTGAGVKAFEHAASLGLAEPAYYIGEQVLSAALQDKKPRKDVFVKLMDCYEKIGAFDRARRAGEAAYRIDNTDGALGAHVRNLSAQETMNRGGYDKTNKEGGFRANVRDADKQRMLEESERIVKTDDVKDRVLTAAADEFQRRPEDLPALGRYIKALVDRGRPEDEAKALSLLDAAYVRTQQFALRAQAGELRLRQQARQVREIRARVEAAPADAALKAQLQQAHRSFVEAEVAEFKARSEAYPTDLNIKFELGRRYYMLDKFWEAIEQLQEAQHELKNRAGALFCLAQSFLKVEYVDESIETFRRALEIKDITPDLAIEMRYGLMAALQTKAELSRDLPAAEEAEKLASSIAMQQITYRDIRTRREAIKKLLAELRTKPGA